MFAHPETVTIVTPGTKADSYNNTVEDWSTATSREVGCGVAPGGSTEPTEDARNAVDSDLDLIFSEADPGITARDRIEVRGVTYEVDGQPFAWRNPFTGWEAGVVVRVSNREG